MVGQNYIRLLEDHPWFEISFLAASPRSAGRTYKEAIEGRWHMENLLPDRIGAMTVFNALDVSSAADNCELLFSAISMDKAEIIELEMHYAKAGLAVVSNNSALRTDPFVPMIIPEVNHEHLDFIPEQRKHFGFSQGLIITKPNCGIQSYMAPLDALRRSGFPVDRVINTNLQALSGAGYSGPYALDMVDNLMHLAGEESKGLSEPQKLFGQLSREGIVSSNEISVGTHSVRVPVIHGHMSMMSIGFKEAKCSVEEAVRIFKEYKSLPQELNLPSAPQPAIEYIEGDNRPQPHKDRNRGKGMAVSAGRLRECPVLDLRFASLSHNTVRGAAGGAILSAELLAERGFYR